MNAEGKQLVEAVHVVSEHMAGQIGDPNLTASWDVVLRLLHGEIEIPIGGARPAASEDDLALGLRVEAAIKRLDTRLADDSRWRDAVADWRDSVRRRGPGSAAACGDLLALVRIAWFAPIRFTSASDGSEVEYERQNVQHENGHGPAWVEIAYGHTDLDGLTEALEAAP